MPELILEWCDRIAQTIGKEARPNRMSLANLLTRAANIIHEAAICNCGKKYLEGI
jgi:hypothetical protein